MAQTLVHVLQACGDNLTRENVMKQATSLRDLELVASCRASRSTRPPLTLRRFRRCK